MIEYGNDKDDNDNNDDNDDDTIPYPVIVMAAVADAIESTVATRMRRNGV